MAVRTNYQEFVETARELLFEFGQPVQLIRKSRGAKDPEKPWLGPDDCGDETLTVEGAVTEFDQNQIDGDLVRRGDLQLWIAIPELATGETLPPLAEMDFAVVNNIRYAIQDVLVVQPAATPVTYRYQLRR